ncbi:MAG: DNA repair protein RecN [Chloroflexota bacterium]
MLLELSIRDFAIVDSLRLSLDQGLNALTGETGAGKSILIDALGVVLGERANPAMIRAGAARAIIDATFTRPASLPAEIEDLDVGEDDVLILSREIHAGGRGVARLNGRSVPLSLLQRVGRLLVDIHGQSDHQALTRPATHLHFLDRYAGLDQDRLAVAAAVQRLRQARQELAALRQTERDVARQQDLLRFQVDEIDRAELAPDQDTDLARVRNTLASVERRRDLAAAALASLGEEGGAADGASTAAKQLAELARLDAALAGEADKLEAAGLALRETARELARYVDGIEADPEELRRADDRLELIRGLKRKYGATIPDVLAFAQQARRDLAELEAADQRIERLAGDERALLAEACRLAGRLSQARQEAAPGLAEAVEAELADLNMAQARFEVSIRCLPAEGGPGLAGLDEVEFLLAANPGEPARPLVQVASGGEASRLMLALKSVFSEADETPVLVFDEIEAGVGARGGHIIGEKLLALAARHQVLCITHLAPVAALAREHFRVRKVPLEGRTTTAIDTLHGEERVQELAEMLAGQPVSPAALASARSLLAASRDGPPPPP